VTRSLVASSRSRGGRQQRSRGLLGRLALGAAAAAVVAIPFTLLLLLVLSEWEPLERLDKSVADDLHGNVLGHRAAVKVLDVGSNVLDPFVFRAVVVLVAGWLWWRGAKRLAIWALVTMAIGGVLGVVLKLVVERARPGFPEPIATASGYSFPSGHALNSMLCVGIVILVFLPVLDRVGRLIAFAVGAALVLLTGYDRIALGVHYVSDVVAGWVVALACLAGTTAAFEIWRREHGLRPSTVEEGVDPEAESAIRE
jgi:membrane-associated phospholipid phosphatase